MVEADVRIVYGFDFDEKLFAAEIAAARKVQNPDISPYGTDKFTPALKEEVARRLPPADFQLLGGFDIPLVFGYEVLKVDGREAPEIYGRGAPTGGSVRYDHLIVSLSEALEKTKEMAGEWGHRLRGAIDCLYGQDDSRPKPELKLLVWHPS